VKTVLVNGRFLTQRVTGVQRFARELLFALSRRGGNDFRFVVAAPRGELVQPLPAVEVRQDDFFIKGHAWEQARLPLLFKKSGADLLWSPCNTGPAAVSRQVVTIHDAAVFAGPQWFSPAFGGSYRALHRVLGRRCRMVMTDSVFSRRELAKYGVAPEEKIRVVPGGVTLPPPGLKAAAPKGSYLLALSSRDPRKDVKTLLEAWALLPSELKAGRSLIVAGSGGASFAEESLGAVPAGVKFPGYVPDEELPALYAGAEAFVVCSLYEGFALPALEAMAAGAPVVASDIPTHREVCGEAAHYFPAGDAQALAERIEAFFYNPDLRADLTRAGRRRAAGLSWDAAAEDLLSSLEEAL
jgi:glycosyltransferase involved in cell wall biosynthesis